MITHLNPDTLHKNPAFTQAITVDGPVRMVYVGGQNAVNAQGEVVGDDLRTQSEQALRNVLAALEAAGATQQDVVKLGIYIVQGQDIREGYAAAQTVWGMYPTCITGIFVAGLADPRFLVEIEAVAAVTVDRFTAEVEEVAAVGARPGAGF
jgi:2-iminobutanoate/2-iminopropanoate deaminase